MAHIDLPDGVPGIRSLAMFRPETGKHLYELAQVLLRGPSPLTAAEREIIAAYVSDRNHCVFCTASHAAAARYLLGGEASEMDEVLSHDGSPRLTPKMNALLQVAGKVQVSGREVSPADIAGCREAGATDEDIHDTVLIAATFSMFNRYVDGLNSFTPESESDYLDMGKRMAESGYVPPASKSKH